MVGSEEVAASNRTVSPDDDPGAGRSSTTTASPWTYAYTPANLVASVSYSGSSAHSVSYSYDADGNKVAMSDATGSQSYAYDPFGELTSATNGAGQTVSYAYNANGEATGITYPLPSTATWATTDTVGYGYDDAGRLTSVSDFDNNTISISNTADGLPYSETLGTSGDSIATTYDPTDSPSAIDLESGSSTLLGFSYSYAPSGAILAETDTPSTSQSPADYSYDAQSRVTSMTPGSGSTLNYGFDASGNLTVLPTGATGTYDDAGELTSSVLSGTTTSYSYDADGERLSAKQGSTTVASGTWNGAGELTSYSNPAADMSSADYDGNGLRASETSTPSGGSPLTQDFVWDTTSSVPSLLMDSTNAYIFAGSGTPAEQVNLSTGAISYLVADGLGSVRGVVTSSGSLSASVDYDAWGNPETAGGLAAYTPFGFAGAYTDPSGMIYLIGRYYDPATGQFVSVDPELQQTQEAYAYTGGDPVDESDPSGTAWCDWAPFGCGVLPGGRPGTRNGTNVQYSPVGSFTAQAATTIALCQGLSWVLPLEGSLWCSQQDTEPVETAQLNRGRIQAQGAGLQLSVSWASHIPPSVTDGLVMLGELASMLSARQLAARNQAIANASTFIIRCGRAAGCSPQSRSFRNKGALRGARIDIEIISGVAFLPDIVDFQNLM